MDPHCSSRSSSGSSPLIKIPTAHLDLPTWIPAAHPDPRLDPYRSSRSSSRSLLLARILVKIPTAHWILGALLDPRRDPRRSSGSSSRSPPLARILGARPDPFIVDQPTPAAMSGPVQKPDLKPSAEFNKPSRRCRRYELRQQRTFLDPARPQDFGRR